MKRSNSKIRAIAVPAPRTLEPTSWVLLIAAASLIALSYAISSALR